MWRFRKVFSFGRFRTSLSKKGIGYSYGFPGLRFGVSPNGKRYISFGIPGTGFYFVKYFENPISDWRESPGAKSISSSKTEWWKQKNLEKF